MTQAIDNDQRGYGMPSSDVKESLLPANLTTDELNKIYFAFSSDATIDMATGMYAYGNAKAPNEPWQSKATIDYHGDGQAALGVSIVNNTGNELKNILAIVNVPKVSDASHFAVNLTGDLTELIDPSTNKVLNDGVTVLYSTQTANLATSDLSTFVPASEIKDWQQVQAVAIKLSNLGGMSSRQVKIPVNVTDLLDKIGKVGVIGTRAQADGLLPMVTTPESERAAKVVVGGQATIEAQMHYRDAQGQDHIIAMPNVTKHYDVTKSTTLAIKDFMPTATDRANIPAGYALSKDAPTVVAGKALLGQTVTAAMDRSVLQFELVPTTQQIVVNFVDDDNSGQKVAEPITYTGTTGQTIDTPIANKIPEHYVLSDMSQVPSQMVVAPHDQTVTVHLKHATQDVSGTDPQAKIEREYSIVQKIPQINHDVNGKVTYTTKTLLNDWHFVRQRPATKDLVTGEINYGQWLGYGPGVFASPEFGIDKIDYTKLTSPIGASEQLLMWLAGESTSESYKKFIDYLGLDPDQFVTLVGMADFDGNSGKNEADRERFNEGLKLGTGNFGSGNDNDVNFKGMIWKAGSSHNHLYLNPSYKDYDKSFDLFSKTGLNDASYDFYNEVLPKSQTIELISQPVDLPVTINYKDTATGEIVGTDSLTTNYYQDFLLPDHTPAGYVAVDPSVFKNARSVRAAGDQLTTTFEIPVHHKMVTVTPDHPKTPNDKLPDNPTKSYPSGVAEADLNKTLTRTIKVTTPDGKTTTISQVAKLTRTAEVDEVTGEVVKYSDWTTGTWGAFTPKEVEGYTPTPEVVAQQAVTADMGDQTVVVTYTADAQTIEVRYVDDDDHEKLVHTNTVSGKSDQTVTITPAAPAGYELVDATPITYQVTVQPNQVVTVHVKHQTSTTTQSKTLTRTIELHTPHDGVKIVKQTVELTRTVGTDQVTGRKTYGNWSTGTWAAYVPTTYPGYEANLKLVPQVNLTGTEADQTVVVTYTADAQTIEVRYVDDDDHEKLVHTNTVSGKSDQTVTITPAAPAGYELVDATPITYQVTAQPNQVVTVHVKHQTGTTTQSKTLTRTIELHTPFDGVKLIKQVAELTRPVTLDQATGQSTTGAWSTGQWDAYQVPTYAGYAPTIDVVPAVNLTGAATDQTVVINYQALQHTTHVNYVDENGTLVHTTTLSGKTNEVVTVPNEVPSGWQLVAGQTLPSEVTFTATGYPDTTVTIAHRVITVTADQPQPNGTKLPDNPALTFNGVENADLNRTVTRQIVINLPGQSPQTITQTVHLTRNATVDEVTGQVTYGAWTSGEWTAVTVPTVAGFTPSQSEVPAVAVTATTASQVITINYQAIPAVPTKVTPTKPQAKVAATGKPVVAPQAAAPVQPTSTTERRLPQTGNQAAATGQIWGLLAASLATGLGLWHTKKKEQKG